VSTTPPPERFPAPDVLQVDAVLDNDETSGLQQQQEQQQQCGGGEAPC
jgi:hypothetical protein